MLSRSWFASILSVLILCSSFKGDRVALTNSCSWQQTFGDPFDDATLNTALWNTSYGSGNNGEQQYYAADAFELQDGILRIRADRREMNGYPYTSGIIHTLNRFDQKYGYFKMRAKLPKGRGLWPAFWLLPTSRSYPWEVDIFEMLGHDSNTLHLTSHWQDADGNHNKNSNVYTGTDFSEDFHIFGLKWSPTEIIWEVDYVERFRTDLGVPQEPMFLLANLAVGGNWPGNPDASTPFPSYFEIDYIYAYKQMCKVFIPVVQH